MSDETLRSLAVIFACAALAPLLAARLRRWLLVPTVVLELSLGIVVGPTLLDWATVDDTISGLSQIGLSVLMLLAGYEIDFARIRGGPLSLAVRGWAMSLLIGFGAAGLLMLAGEPTGVRELALGLVFTTTAIGTLLPILRDSGLSRTSFGAYVLAAGAVGEFGPIVGVSLLLVGDKPARTIALLGVFVAIAAGAILLALRPRRPFFLRLIGETLTTSGQVAVRVAVLLCTVMVWFAATLGLDVLIGAFTAGIVLRLFLSSVPGEHREVVESKLEAVGFGFLVPLFFVVSGINLEVDELIEHPATFTIVGIALALFLVARGLPALLLYRHVLTGDERRALALYSATGLPLVVVISNLGVSEQLIKPATGAALVAAGMLSVLVLPLLAGRVLGQVQPQLVDEQA